MIHKVPTTPDDPSRGVVAGIAELCARAELPRATIDHVLHGTTIGTNAVLEHDGEVIQRADPHIGLLHRATEKLAESKTFIQSLPYMDRLDYVSMMCNEHAYVMAIEKLAGVQVPVRAQYIRVMFDEITRVLNHLLWLGAHGLDCGAMTIFLYCFREREDLMDAYEFTSASRHRRRARGDPNTSTIGGSSLRSEAEFGRPARTVCTTRRR